MDTKLLTPREVDQVLRYSHGRTLRLAKAGHIPFIRLPDGEIRFDEAEIEKLLTAGISKGAGTSSHKCEDANGRGGTP